MYQVHAKPAMSRAVVRLEPQRLAELALRLRLGPAGCERKRQVVMSLRIGWIELRGLPKHSRGFAILLALSQRNSKREKCARVTRLESRTGPELLDRTRRILLRLKEQPEIVGSFGKPRGPREHVSQQPLGAAHVALLLTGAGKQVSGLNEIRPVLD